MLVSFPSLAKRGGGDYSDISSFHYSNNGKVSLVRRERKREGS
jgi:hypothetical protein